MDARLGKFVPLVSYSLGQGCCVPQYLPSEKHPANAKRAWRCNAPSIGRCLAARLAARCRLRDWLRRRVLTSRLGMPALKQGTRRARPYDSEPRDVAYAGFGNAR